MLALAGALIAIPQGAAAAATPGTSAGTSCSYVVRPGDSLASIAERFYGAAADWRQLYQANAWLIADPDVIYPDQVFVVPCDQPAGGISGQPEDPALATAGATAGTLSCAGLEDLWEAAGGTDGEALMAAKIAMAESGGQQYATGHDTDGTDDVGYFQVNTSHGPALATYSALGNAEAAVLISDDGTNWTPWTTFRTGAFSGECASS